MQRVPLAHLPTRVEPMDRLGAHLGMDEGALLVKRDDCTGLAGGGNKARKLEFLCADALARGCDTLVTGGGVQSNHVRMTAAAAARLGLQCTILLAADEGGAPDGNVVLDLLFEPEIVWAGPLGYHRLEKAVAAAGARLEEAGRRPYVIPIGGASDVGALGYVAGAAELREQVPDLALVVLGCGSGGTHAGLVAGLGDHAMVLGVDVGARPDLVEVVPAKAASVARLAGLSEPKGALRLDRDHIGPGYGTPTHEGREAVRLAARLEGLVLDPVYTGKAMAGLIAGVIEGRIARSERVVFLHTGGMAALFAAEYAGWVRGDEAGAPAAAGLG